MNKFMSKREQNKILKDKVLDKLREGPLYFAELKEFFGLKKDNLSNVLISLKYFGLIETYHKDLTAAPNKRRWVAVEGAITFKETLEQAEKTNKAKAEETYSPYATMKHSSADHHPTGNKHKINPWLGYSSF